MRERILKTLKAYLQINKDVLSQEEIENIEKQIETVNKTVNVNVIKEKELVNKNGKKFHIVEVKPEIIFILDENNNFVESYCGTIDEDEDNLMLLNRI